MLTRAEQEAILGRPLADGLTWEQYCILTGDNLGGGFGPGGLAALGSARSEQARR
ncbi:MAG TPA: hypothetical protein VHF67_08865 [Gaiellaceae bacterium]|nr:hypothetical protein [Gaiellaceae bacterium]